MKTGLILVSALAALIVLGWTINAKAAPTASEVTCNATIDAVAAPQAAPPTPTGAGTPASPTAMVSIVGGEHACLNSVFLVALSDSFGKAALASLATDAPGFAKKFKLYLNDVPMAGLQEPQQIAPPPGTPAETLHLKFKLNRDSHDDENRKSWNQFLSGIKIGGNQVTVGLSFNGGLIHESSNKLRYSTRPSALIWTLLGAGIAILIGTLWFLVKGTTMLRDKGAETPYSLGKTQMAVWGLLVALCFVGVLIVSGQMERIPDQTLMLLGIAGATGLLSLMVAAEKKTEDAKPLARAKKSTGWLTDIISDENGPSFHRLQVVIWTAILGCVFVWTVASTFSMPEFDKTLLLLLGISNGTYLGFKFKEA